MQGAGNKVHDIMTGLFGRPDEMIQEVGAAGELVIARLRVVVAGLLLLLPLANNFSGGSLSETLIGLAGAVFVNVFAQVWLALARSARRHRWLPFATTAFDVTATTLVLILLASNHLPSALNSMVVWCGYVLAIMLTALRTDGRTTLLAGGLAIGQYGLLVAVIFAITSSPEQLISTEYGTVTLGNQTQRIILLAVVTLITTMVVYRMQRLVEMSGTDSLTRLPNRTWLVHRMPQMLDSAKAEGGSLTVVLIDLDHFKRVNDELGQHAGDRALRQVVTTLRAQLEAGEKLVRMSGAEFVLALRKPVGTAWERVDAMRRLLADKAFEADRSGIPTHITFSAGMASFPQDGQDLSRLLRRADQRLEAAKRAGRNRVVARDT